MLSGGRLFGSRFGLRSGFGSGLKSGWLGGVRLIGDGYRLLSERVAAPGFPGAAWGLAHRFEAAAAHLPEARDDIAAFGAGHGHGVVVEVVQPFGQAGHGGGVVAVVLGAPGE